MANGFTKLFSLEKNLYVTGSPLIICAGALLCDRATKKIIVQLKFKNISDKTIKAVKVSIISKDTADRLLGDPVEYEYLDLNEKRDTEFGSKTPVILPDSRARKYDVRITEVIFSSNEIWKSNATVWEPVPAQKPLFPEDPELKKQYETEVNSRASMDLLEFKDLWLCNCGAINRSGECFCHSCSAEHVKLKNADLTLLEEHKEERLALEAQEREKEAIRQKELQAENAKKAKKFGIIGGIAAVILAAIFLVNYLVIRPAKNYEAAVAAMEAGRFSDAVTLFESLGSYKDSETMVLECKYQTATQEMNTGEFEDGLNHFLELGDYKDAADQYDLFNEYTDAMEKACGSFNYDAALKFFEAHPDYINSSGWCTMTKAIKAYNEKDYETAYKEICSMNKDDFCCNETSTQCYDAYYASIGSMYAFHTDPFSVKEAVEILENVNTEYSDVSMPLETLQPMADCDGTYTCADNGLEITLTHYMHNGGDYTLTIEHNLKNVTLDKDPTVYYAKDGTHDWKVMVAGKVDGKDQVFYIYYSPTEVVVDGGSAGEKRTAGSKEYTNSKDFGKYTFTR